MNLSLAFDYEYVSDPPIFADIGNATFGMKNWYFNFTETSDIVDDQYIT